ncbi:hypothetical protein M0804_000047 [Polistes exclamans]|nr:hypothetical protein M0804_000047 [Polistes exclamans]
MRFELRRPHQSRTYTNTNFKFVANPARRTNVQNLPYQWYTENNGIRYKDNSNKTRGHEEVVRPGVLTSCEPITMLSSAQQQG